ncbi:MAG: zf-HC2 domain-containing protein [Candidatus Moduliflexus flocculans]|nr:zf-HC2 domain-containing protein [Candidatus Moduliflexus flocculans]
MTCERFEELLSAYLEGGLAAAERAEVDAHLAACAECAELAGLMRRPWPPRRPSPRSSPRRPSWPGSTPSRRRPREKKRIFRPVFDWLARPALQPVYAALSGPVHRPVLRPLPPGGAGHPEADRRPVPPRTSGAVEKLYADAGGLKGEIKAAVRQRRQDRSTPWACSGGDEKKQ